VAVRGKEGRGWSEGSELLLAVLCICSYFMAQEMKNDVMENIQVRDPITTCGSSN
jgi:hypothetical protein